MKHSYATYKVYNPSENHSVPLLPGQNFRLNLNDPNDTAELDFKSDFFFLRKREHADEFTSFTFDQKYDLNSWSMFSKVFLGDILVCYQNKLSHLYVYLDSKDDIFTVINPSNSSIKVSLDSTIEVVILSNNFKLDWQSNLTSFITPNAIKQTSYRRVFAYQHTFFQGIPVIHRGATLNQYGIEHHFWYRFSDDLPKEDNFVGKIVLTSGEESKILNVNVTDKKRRSNHLERKSVRSRRNFYYPNVAFNRNKGIMKSEVTFSKRVNSDLDDHCEAYIMSFEE